jgi:hypothetical protein
MNYTYALRGDGQTVTEIVSPGVQRAAMDALIETLRPEVLALDERILRLLAPRSPGSQRGRETFTARSDPVFDPLVAAEAAASHSIGLMLHPARAARLVQFHARDEKYPAFEETIDRLIDATWKNSQENRYRAEIGRAADQVLLYHLMNLAANNEAAPQVRAVAESKLRELMVWLESSLGRTQKRDEAQAAHYLFAISSIARFLENPAGIELSAPAVMPDGSPI